MNNLRKKLKYITIGYLFVFLNIIAIILDFKIIGGIFGLFSFYFFIKSLLIKKD